MAPVRLAGQWGPGALVAWSDVPSVGLDQVRAVVSRLVVAAQRSRAPVDAALDAREQTEAVVDVRAVLSNWRRAVGELAVAVNADGVGARAVQGLQVRVNNALALGRQAVDALAGVGVEVPGVVAVLDQPLSEIRTAVWLVWDSDPRTGLEQVTSRVTRVADRFERLVGPLAVALRQAGSHAVGEGRDDGRGWWSCSGRVSASWPETHVGWIRGG